MEKADGIGAAANTSDEEVGQAASFFEDLRRASSPITRLEVADDEGIGVATIDSAENVMGGANVGDPVTHGFVDGFLRVCWPALTGTTSAPASHPDDVRVWRSQSTAPM